MEPTVKAAVAKTLYSGFIGQGKKVEEFERALQPWVGRKTILTTNSCTSALQLALRLSDVGPGDEVITTPMTCTATNEPILAQGAKIVWADVDAWTGLIDPMDVAKKITKKTKAVICVHWGGRACELDELVGIAESRGIKLIEDAAHALGGMYKGRPIGGHGDFVALSFQAIKHVTCGDGGALVCKSKADYEKGKLLRWYGIKRPANLKRDIKEWGYKFHMNDIAATIGLANLKGLEADLKARRRNADLFAKTFPEVSSYDGESAFWFYPIHRDDREKFMAKMRKQNIMTGPAHERNDRYSMFKASRTSLPGVDAFCKTQVNLPCGPWVRAGEVIRAYEQD